MFKKTVQKLEQLGKLLAGAGRTRKTAAIILAAGKSERMQEDGLSKQLLTIESVPVVVYAALAFEKSEHIHEIIIVSAEKEIPLYREFKKKYALTKLKFVTAGGACRAESAIRGFRKVSPDCQFVAIHDAARCLIQTEDIDRVLLEAYRFGAAIAAVKATDTVKQSDENGFVVKTIDRNTLWHAQTPQVFKKSVYETAIAAAGAVDSSITDDSMLIEKAGFRVKLVECLSDNMKITTQADFIKVRDKIERRKTEKTQ